MPRYEELYLKTGQVITEDWYARLVDVLEELSEEGAVTYGGIVKSDLIPEYDLMMKLGDAGQRFLALFSGYGYISFSVFVGDKEVIDPDRNLKNIKSLQIDTTEVIGSDRKIRNIYSIEFTGAGAYLLFPEFDTNDRLELYRELDGSIGIFNRTRGFWIFRCSQAGDFEIANHLKIWGNTIRDSSDAIRITLGDTTRIWAELQADKFKAYSASGGVTLEELEVGDSAGVWLRFKNTDGNVRVGIDSSERFMVYDDQNTAILFYVESGTGNAWIKGNLEVAGSIFGRYGAGLTAGGTKITKYWKVGELPYSSLSTYQKLYIQVWGGGYPAWTWQLSGIDEYVVATRDKKIVYRMRKLGETAGYSLKIFDDGSKYIVCIALENVDYPNILIRAFKLDSPDRWVEVKIEDVTDHVSSWTDVTDQFEFVDILLTDKYGNVIIGKILQINGNEIKDSTGTTRIILGDPLTLNENVKISAANPELTIEETESDTFFPKVIMKNPQRTWQLQVDAYGYFRIFDATAFENRMIMYFNTSANSKQVEFLNSSGNTIMYIDYEGDVYATSFNATSTREQKIDLELFQTDFLSLIKNINIYKYKLKRDPDRLRVGIIAEELPELIVNKDERGKITGYDVNQLISLLLGAIKQLAAKVDELQQQIEELKSQLQELQSQSESVTSSDTASQLNAEGEVNEAS